MSLSAIPNDPASPSEADSAEAVELPAQAQRRFDEAKRLFAEHRYTETISELERALRYAPKHFESQRLLALASMLAGNDGQARSAAEWALGARPNDLACHYVLARLADKAKKEDEALRRYRSALKCRVGPDDQALLLLVHYYLGEHLDAQGYFAAAAEQLDAFERGLQAWGDANISNPELATISRVHRGAAAQRAARAHTLLGNDAAAADAWQVAVQQRPDDLELRPPFVSALVRAGRLDQAEAEVRRLLSGSSVSRSALRLVMDFYQHVGRPERGLESVGEVAAANPDNIDLAMLYAEGLISSGQFGKAKTVLDQAVAAHPDSDDARWQRVGLHRRQKDWRGWLVATATELTRKPESQDRAEVELAAAPEATATAIINEALADSSGGRLTPAPEQVGESAAALYYLYARLSDRLDRLTEARRFLERSIEEQPGFFPAVIGTARMYVQRNRWQQALDALAGIDTDAIKEDKALSAIIGLRAQCHDGLDHIDRAEQYYNRAIKLDDSRVELRLQFGRMYDRQARFLQARRQYQEAVQAAPDHLGVREALIRSLLADDSIRNDIAEFRALRGKVLAQLLDMRRIDEHHPATVRCSSLIEYRFSGESDAARYYERLHRIIERYPDDLRSRVDAAAVLLFNLKDYERARKEISEVLARDSFHPEGNELMSVALTKLLLFDEAAAHFERMLDMYPNRTPWIENFADVRLIQQDYDAAAALYWRIFELSPDDANQRFARQQAWVSCLLEAKRFDAAIKQLTEWLEPMVENSTSRMLLRRLLLEAYRRAERHEQFVEQCQTWLEEDEEDGTIQYFLILGLRNADRHDEAILRCLEKIESEANADEWAVQVWDMLLNAGRFDEAIEIAKNELAAAEPRDRRRRMDQLAMAYGRARRHDEQVKLLRKLLVESANDGDAAVDVQSSLAAALSMSGEYEEAVGLMNELIEEDERRSAAEPDYVSIKVELLKQLALIHQRHDRIDLTIARLKEAYDVEPMDPGLNNDLGYTMADAGRDLDEAERMIRLAVAAHPREAAYLDSLGWLMYKKGHFEEARVWLNRGAALQEGQDPVIYDHLGDSHWRLGQKDQAVEAWKRSLELQAEKMRHGLLPLTDPLGPTVERKLNAIEDGREPIVAKTADN